MSEKTKVFEVKGQDSTLYVKDLIDIDCFINDIDNQELGEAYVITVIEMDQDEFDKLEAFDGF